MGVMRPLCCADGDQVTTTMRIASSDGTMTKDFTIQGFVKAKPSCKYTRAYLKARQAHAPITSELELWEPEGDERDAVKTKVANSKAAMDNKVEKVVVDVSVYDSDDIPVAVSNVNLRLHWILVESHVTDTVAEDSAVNQEVRKNTSPTMLYTHEYEYEVASRYRDKPGTYKLELRLFGGVSDGVVLNKTDENASYCVILAVDNIVVKCRGLRYWLDGSCNYTVPILGFSIGGTLVLAAVLFRFAWMPSHLRRCRPLRHAASSFAYRRCSLACTLVPTVHSLSRCGQHRRRLHAKRVVARTVFLAKKKLKRQNQRRSTTDTAWMERIPRHRSWFGGGGKLLSPPGTGETPLRALPGGSPEPGMLLEVSPSMDHPSCCQQAPCLSA